MQPFLLCDMPHAESKSIAPINGLLEGQRESFVLRHFDRADPKLVSAIGFCL